MKEEHCVNYKCEVCDETYDNAENAAVCEARPITQDKGAKVGDKVVITDGEGIGETAIVTRTFVHSRYWGPGTKWWHTVAVNADIVDGFGSRQLTFDSYEVIK